MREEVFGTWCVRIARGCRIEDYITAVLCGIAMTISYIEGVLYLQRKWRMGHQKRGESSWYQQSVSAKRHSPQVARLSRCLLGCRKQRGVKVRGVGGGREVKVDEKDERVSTASFTDLLF